MFSFARLIVPCGALLFGTMASLAVDAMTAGNDSLDGLSFSGQTREVENSGYHDDTIIFRDRMFQSLVARTQGFAPGPYYVKKLDGAYHFSATLRREDGARLDWKGTVEGDTARASYRWVHERWNWLIDRQYRFEGSLTQSQ